MYLHSLPTNRKNVPELIKDPIALVKDVRTVVEQHRHDNPELAVTGKSVLRVGMEDIDLDVSKFEDSLLAYEYSQICFIL